MKNDINIFGENIVVGTINGVVFMAINGYNDNTVIFDENDIDALNDFLFGEQNNETIGVIDDYDIDEFGKKYPVTILNLKGHKYHLTIEDINEINDAVSYLIDLI